MSRPRMRTGVLVVDIDPMSYPLASQPWSNREYWDAQEQEAREEYAWELEMKWEWGRD